MTAVMLSCGEASGDLYAGALVRELRARDPALRAFGFGGHQLRAAGAELIGEYAGLTVTGLVEVVRLLPHTYRMYRRLVDTARERRPDVFVAIDFPDFNFRLAAAVHRLGIPVVYYISPQLWAWRSGRLHTMKRFVDRVLVIFPFEEGIYKEAGVPVQFVGHPLIDLVGGAEARHTLLAPLMLRPDSPTVALLPGSRPNEVREILPGLVASAQSIAERIGDVQFVVARAPNLDDELFAPLARARERRLPVAVVDGRTDSVLAAADVVITASGTATIQAALHGKPMVIVYRLSPLTYRLGVRFVKVRTYGMVNLVAGRTVVPELIQDDFTPEAVTRETLALLTDPVRAAAAREAIGEVVARLGGAGASGRAAEAVLSVAAAHRAA